MRPNIGDYYIQRTPRGWDVLKLVKVTLIDGVWRAHLLVFTHSSEKPLLPNLDAMPVAVWHRVITREELPDDVEILGNRAHAPFDLHGYSIWLENFEAFNNGSLNAVPSEADISSTASATKRSEEYIDESGEFITDRTKARMIKSELSNLIERFEQVRENRLLIETLRAELDMIGSMYGADSL